MTLLCGLSGSGLIAGELGYRGSETAQRLLQGRKSPSRLQRLLVQINATVYLDGDEHTGDDPQTLLYSLTGQTLPLNQISSWLIGQVDKNKVLDLQTLPTGQPERFIFKPAAQPTLLPVGSSWSVHYQKYGTVDNLKLPSQIQISSSQNRIKLKINNWDLY